MSKPGCERARLVEAMFDGRLGPAERASTERHLKGCDSCEALLGELTSLQVVLRSTGSKPVSPLEHQRARLVLLRQSVEPVVTKRRPKALVVAALLVLPAAVLAAASPSSPLQLWSTPARLPKIAPSQPSHRAPTRRPTPLALSAQLATTTTAEPLIPSQSAHPVPSTPQRRAGAERPTPVASAATLSQASLDFADAMQALSRGDFGASAGKLNRFVAAHPSDARAEDATYLEAIALERAGRLGDASASARRYLALYPNGAHDVQARRIAGDSTP
jgi:hypothetical protein